MPKRNIVVVGNGLFGSIAATLARSLGHKVVVVSDERPLSASAASGCVLAPSWLSSLDKHSIETAMFVLRSLYKVEDIVFRTNLLKTFKASRVNPDDVIVRPDVVGRVVEVGDGFVVLEDGRRFKGIVLVAAGYWSQDLINMPPIRGLFGASLRFKAQLADPRIHVYAPYRQAVAVNLDKKTVWMGDGTALVHTTWAKEEDARVAKTIERAGTYFGLAGKPVRVAVGCRPYVEGHKSGYFHQVTPNVYVSTGGAKNGTVLAAWQAHLFMEALR